LNKLTLTENSGGALYISENANDVGITFKDQAGTERYCFMLTGGSDIVALCNRAADGIVQIRANTSTGGSGGEVTVAQFEDDKSIFYKPIRVSNSDYLGHFTIDRTGNANIDQYIYLTASYLTANNTAFAIDIGGNRIALFQETGGLVLDVGNTYIGVNGDTDLLQLSSRALTISGNTTISGTTYFAGGTTYKIDTAGEAYFANLLIPDGVQESNLNTALSILSLYNSDLQFDQLQFNPPDTAEYKSGGTWYSDTVPTSLFRGGIMNGADTITNGWEAYRLTWTSMSYRFFEALYIKCSTSGNSLVVMVEKSTDGTTWETIFTSDSFSTWPGHFIYKKFFSNNGYPYIRITFTPTWNNDNNISLYQIRYFGAYPIDVPEKLFT